MAKVIAGEAILAGELTQPELYPLLGLELIGFGIYRGIKHHQEKKQHKKDEEQKQRQIDEDRAFEENKRREEEQYQIEQQRIQREAEEQKQREDERIAEQNRIDQLRQQQVEENKQAVQNALQRNDEIENQLMQDRRDRLRARDVYVSGYFQDQSWSDRFAMAMGAGPERSRDEQWRYISGDYIPNYPNNDPNPGGNDDPDPNQNQGDEDRPYQNRNMRNPYEHIIQDLGRQIAQNAINKKQSDEQKQEQKQEEQKQDEQKPPGWNPASWQPQVQNGESVSDQSLVENELLAIIESQGQSELNQEANLNLQFEQAKQLQRIDQDLTSIIERQVQIDPTQLFSSTLATF